MAFLTVERGSEKGHRIDLPMGRTVVFGRGAEVDIATTDHLCAPRHFEVIEKDGAHFVRDLGSEHGTRVNEARISSKYRLRPGDIIHVGETQLVYSAETPGTTRRDSSRVIGGYQLLERLGRGGMGAVYKANQTSLNRVVALKLLSKRISSDPAFVKRFQSEAQAAGRLNHPNIVQVYDVGYDQGLHYYSMEYIENGSVQDLATRVGLLDHDLALGIITDAARGLVYAEKKGLVHRDIKPDNLMINSEGVVKIADLGLAHDAGERARTAGDSESDEDAVFGTPQFISPEQAQGLTVDTRSDIYSLGATYYRLVTGQPPFTGDDIAEIVEKQVNEQPEPARNLRADCPQKVVAIIERAMQKDPAARFQTAQELLTALEAADDAIKGRKPRMLVIAASVLAIVALGAAGWFLTRPKPEPPPVTPPPVDSRAQTSGIDAAALTSIERERDAARAFREASEFEKQAIASGKPDLAAVRERYERVATRFADTPDGRDAHSRATELTTRIADAESRATAATEAAASRARAAKDASESAIAEAAAHGAADRFSAAMAVMRRARRQVLGTEHQAAVDTAMTRALGRASARADEILAAVPPEASADDAETPLLAAAEAFAAGDAGVDRELETLVSRLTTAAGEVRARRAVRIVSDQTHDAVMLDRARKDIARVICGSFDPDAASSSLSAAAATMRDPSSAAGLAPERAMLDAMARVRDRFVAAVRSDDAKATRVKLPGATDKKRLQDVIVTRADAKGLVVKRGGVETNVPFASLTGVEAWDLLFADVVTKDDGARADAIEFLMMLGLPERAAALAEAMPESPARQAMLARLAREREAAGILADIRDLAPKAASDETALNRLYRAVSRLIAEFSDTRAYLLNRRPPSPAPAASRPTTP